MKRLTDKEWDDAKPPMHWCRIKTPVDSIYFDLMVKWLLAATGDQWFYFDGSSFFIFETNAQMVMFKLWLRSNPFLEDHGVISNEG